MSPLAPIIGVPLGTAVLLYLVLRYPLLLVLVDIAGCVACLLTAQAASGPERLLWVAAAVWLAFRAYWNWRDRHRHRRLLELLGYKARAARARLLASMPRPRPTRVGRPLPNPA